MKLTNTGSPLGSGEQAERVFLFAESCRGGGALLQACYIDLCGRRRGLVSGGGGGIAVGARLCCGTEAPRQTL